MKMPNSVALFNQCLEHEESFPDKFYCRDDLIISLSHEEATDIMNLNTQLIERITAAKVSLADKNRRFYSEQIRNIAEILRNTHMNFVEFTSFFPCLDINFSVYNKLTESKQIKFLRIAVEKYIKKRHDIYMSHGYTATSIQVRKDFEKHKTEGESGNRKVKSIFKSSQNFSEFKGGDFSSSKSGYCLIGTPVGKKALENIYEKLNLRFKWSSDRGNKKPDILFSNGKKHVFICEMKHMKESGGGQSKQMNELIDFIKYKERSKRVHYVSFLDGIYFNKLKNPSEKNILSQKKNILRYLKKNPGYYFVNTFGFKKLLGDVD